MVSISFRRRRRKKPPAGTEERGVPGGSAGINIPSNAGVKDLDKFLTDRKTISGGGGGGGGSGGGSTPTINIAKPPEKEEVKVIPPKKNPPVSSGSGGGSSDPFKDSPQQVREDAKVIEERQKIKEEARRRGRPFTRLEVERRLKAVGGSRFGGAFERDRQRARQGRQTISAFLTSLEPSPVSRSRESLQLEASASQSNSTEVNENKLLSSIDKGLSNISEQKAKIKTSRQRGDKDLLDQTRLFGLSFTGNLLNNARFGVQLFTSPVETTTGAVKGVFGFGKKVITGEGIDVASNIRQLESGEIAGFVTSEALLFKGSGQLFKAGRRVKDVTDVAISPRGRFPKRTGSGEIFLKNVDDIGDVGLIPSGSGLKGIKANFKEFPEARGFDKATTRGAFGFSRKDQAKFIGRTGPVASSQIDLFKPFQKRVKLGGPKGDLDFFATPPQLRLGKPTAQTRTSRLPRPARDATLKDIVSGDFTFRRPKGQIVIFPGEKIGRRGGFRPFGQRSSELEVTLPPGTIIQRNKKLGTTFLNKQKVSVFKASISEKDLLGTSGKNRFNKLSLPKTFSSDLVASKPVLSPTRLGLSIGRSKPRRKTTRTKTTRTTSTTNLTLPTSTFSKFTGGTISLGPGSKGSGRPLSPPRASPTSISPSIFRPRTTPKRVGFRGGIVTPKLDLPPIRIGPPRRRKPRKKVTFKKSKKGPSETQFITRDFTSRSLGIARDVTPKDIKLAKIGRTGLGLRSGVRVRKKKKR